ncbi:MAG TPA: DUF4249 domain-containing protein [Saprospiraceae bacterium]|nr:DUF4249 domain-containing protein [Saprospiraceae bacterium]
MKYRIYIIISISFFLCSCEQEFVPEINNAPPDIVVEGHIEAGDNALPPYIVLTRSTPFFNKIDSSTINNLFVHDAEVKVSVDNIDYNFTEICYNTLTPEQKKIFGQLLNVNLESAGLNFCVYLEPSFQLKGEIGKTYKLNIKAGNKELSSVTTIPQFVKLDSLWFTQPPGTPSDTLRQLYCYISDSKGISDYYRYFTAVNDGPFITGFSSVTDDKFFDGLYFKFALQKAKPRNVDFDPTTYGLFHIGDTARIKWANIDKDHYDFWNTLEFNRQNQGPFSSYTRITTNIKGGLGIWGGYSTGTYSLIVK